MKLAKFLQIFQHKGINRFLMPLLSIIIGILGAAVIIAYLGVNPFEAYIHMFLGSFGSMRGVFSSLQRFIPLAFGGLAVTLAFRAGIINLGVEGQLYMGALFATWVGVSLEGLPLILHLLLSLLAGCIGGALWALIPAYLKAKKGFNEIIICIFLNFIAIYLLGASLKTFLRAPDQGIPWSSRIPETAQLPQILGTTIHFGAIIAVLIAIGIAYILKNRTIGYEIKAVGQNKDAAIFGGINARRIIIMTMVISGAIGSLAGSTEILGIQHRLTENFLVDYGYNAVPVALLGGLNPYGTLLVAFLYGALLNGGSAMQVALGVPVALVDVIMALAIVASIGMHGLQKVVREKSQQRKKRC